VKVKLGPGKVGDTVKGTEELLHDKVNPGAAALTDLVKVNEGMVVTATGFAPLVGVVEETWGGVSTVNERTKFEASGIPLELSLI